MARRMKYTAVFSIIGTICFVALYCKSEFKIFLSAAITFGTISYHLVMRLCVGMIYDTLFHNRIDYHKSWFQSRRFEKNLYKALNVKHWKSFMPTYAPSTFDKSMHTWEEIAQATCQSELVHETIFIFSFVPMLASIRFGAVFVFVFTSICAAGLDLVFVIIQRYNRPRILKLCR